MLLHQWLFIFFETGVLMLSTLVTFSELATISTSWAAALSPWLLLGSGLLLSLLVSSLGFIRSDWFISIGYGLSISVLSLWWTLCQLYRGIWEMPAVLVQLLLLFLYGIRLSAYLLSREYASSFKGELVASRNRSQHIHGPVKIAIWVSVSLLYVAMASPVIWWLPSTKMSLINALLAHPRNHLTPLLSTVWLLPGLLVMAAGLAVEMIADWQKSTAKQQAPQAFVRTGLFAWIRCPNYFGEMLFWSGNLLCALPILLSRHSSNDWIGLCIAVIGWICIELIMIGSARRLERKQNERYGTQPEFQLYRRSVPILLPGIPLYSLQRWKIYLG